MKPRLLYWFARATALLPRRLLIAMSGEPPVIVDGQQLDPQVQLLRAYRRRRVRHGLVEPTVEAGRTRYVRESRMFNPRPPRVGNVRDLDIGPLRARHYAPAQPDRRPLTVYFHGGGFVIGDLETHDVPCRLLCRQSRSHILSVAYRLAPEHPYPAAVEDAMTAFRWACDNAASLGADPKRVAVGGDSAGASLAAVVAIRERPFAQLLVYPPASDDRTDFPSRHLFDKSFFLSLTDHAAFRKYYAPPDSSLLAMSFKTTPPPAVVAIAGFDILRDEAEAYAAKLQDAGTATRILRYPGLGHGFIHMAGVATTARRAVREIGKVWGEVLDG